MTTGACEATGATEAGAADGATIGEAGAGRLGVGVGAVAAPPRAIAPRSFSLPWAAASATERLCSVMPGAKTKRS
ncbi:hypothetical protein D3C72_1389910 [compost metagenome]